MSEERARQEFDLELTGRLLAAGSEPDDSDWVDVVERGRALDPGTRVVAAGRGPQDGDWDAILARAKQLAAQSRPLGVRRPRRRHIRFVAVTATAAAAALALLGTPRTPATLIERAAAAVPGTGEIVHVVWEEDNPHTLVDLSTGQTVWAPQLRVEAWYDRQHDLYHEVATNGNQLVWERWHSPDETLDSTEGDLPSWQFAVPAAIRLFSHYKQALAQGGATLGGTGRMLGRPIYWLVVDTTVATNGPGSSLAFGNVTERDRIAIDRVTLKPIEVETADSGVPGDEPVSRRVLAVSLEQPGQASLSRPIVRPWPLPVRDLDGYPTERSSRPVTTIEEATTVLQTTPAGLQGSLLGLPLTSIVTDELNPEGSAERQGIRILYGAARHGVRDLRGRYVQLDEALQPELAYGFHPYDVGQPDGQIVVSREVPEDVSQAQRGVGAQALQREWVARLQLRSIFLTVRAPSYGLLLDATRTVVGWDH